MRNRIAGVWVMAVAVIHFIFGLFFGRKILAGILQDGLFNAVDPHQDRQLVFWFLFASPLLFLIGQMIYSHDATQKMPSYLGWEMLALILTGGLLMPISGIWLLLIPVLMLMKK